MADRPTQLILGALSRALAEPDGVPLHGGKNTAGLFPATTLGKQAAQRCQDEGYLHPVSSQTRGKIVCDRYGATEKGLALLLSHTSPRQVLEDLVRALEARQDQAGELLAAARQMQASWTSLKTHAEKVLERVAATEDGCNPPGTGGSAWKETVLSFLARWPDRNVTKDCPLPELFRQAKPSVSGLTIGRFHDGLRQLHHDEQIYLHPWTGPLYEIPEPQYALLVGHEIAYYASPRR